MPHTDVIPTSASIASTGKGIRYIGEHCYAFSGKLGIAGSAISCLQGTSGVGYIVGRFLYGANEETGDNFQTVIKLNDTIIYDIIADRTISEFQLQGAVGIDILIPPFTKYDLTIQNISSSASIDWCITFTGRVYGAE